MNQEVLQNILELHKKWLMDDGDGEKADLSDADLRYMDLSGADLRYADLRGADLRYADLNTTNLNYAKLGSAILNSADLGSTILNYADLSSAILNYADPGSAILNSADLGLGEDQPIMRIANHLGLFPIKQFDGNFLLIIMCTIDQYDYKAQITPSHDKLGFKVHSLENGESYDSGNYAPDLTEEEQVHYNKELTEFAFKNRNRIIQLFNENI